MSLSAAWRKATGSILTNAVQPATDKQRSIPAGTPFPRGAMTPIFEPLTMEHRRKLPGNPLEKNNKIYSLATRLLPTLSTFPVSNTQPESTMTAGRLPRIAAQNRC